VFGLVGVGLGIAGSQVSTYLTNRSAERLDVGRREHERDMAADRLRQERTERAYLDLLPVVYRTATYWQSKVNKFVFDAETVLVTKIGPPPTPEDWYRIAAQVVAFGSQDIGALFDKFQSAAGAVQASCLAAQQAHEEEVLGGTSLSAASESVREKQKQLLEVKQRLETQVNGELGVLRRAEASKLVPRGWTKFNRRSL
jgi:hypothetical protein